MGSRAVCRLIAIAVALLLPHPAAGYVLNQPPAGRMLMTIDVDSMPYPFIAGTTTADQIVAMALFEWNNVGIGWRPDFNFFSYRFAPVAQSCARDGVNAITTRYTKCGFLWGDATAVTMSWFDSDGRRVEADIIGNANLWWDYYDGPVRYVGFVPFHDIYRVAVHEAGHIVGLDHERTAPSVMALMHGDVDSIQADDVAGAHAVAFPPAPAASSLVAPSGSIATARPTYVWNAVPDSTHYYLWVDDTTGNKIRRWYTAVEVNCPAGTGSCSMTPETGVAGDSRWWIQTWNPAGYGPWTGPLAFRAPPPVGPATLVSPSGDVNTVTPTYTWNAIAGATWYYLWVDDSSVPAKITQWYRAADAGCGSGTGTCSVTPTTTLAPGAARWWIQTWNAAGYGPWSSPLAFTVVPPPPPGRATLVSPSGTIGLSPTYTWNAVPGATWYYLWVDDTMGTRIAQWYRAAEAGCANGVGTCAVTPTTVLTPGQAMWWIQTWSPNGYGPWSLAMTFTATMPPPPGQATLVSPSGAIATRTPTYTWNAVPGATWYYLWVNDSTGTRITQWFRAGEAGCAGDMPSCSVTPPTALTPGAARWWIQTWNSAGYGPWSTAVPFAVP